MSTGQFWDRSHLHHHPYFSIRSKLKSTIYPKPIKSTTTTVSVRKFWSWFRYSMFKSDRLADCCQRFTPAAICYRIVVIIFVMSIFYAYKQVILVLPTYSMYYVYFGAQEKRHNISPFFTFIHKVILNGKRKILMLLQISLTPPSCMIEVHEVSRLVHIKNCWIYLYTYQHVYYLTGLLIVVIKLITSA